MNDELTQRVARSAGLTPAQAEAAVRTVLAYLTANLPSPVVGRIHELLQGDQTPHNAGDCQALPPAPASPPPTAP